MKNITNQLFVMLRQLNNFAESRPKSLVLSFSAIITVGLGIIDYYMSPDYNFAVFYLVPITITAWFTSSTLGTFMSIFCTATAFTANLFWPRNTVLSNPYIMYWDAVTNLVFFTVTALILSKLKKIIQQESSYARTDYLTGISNSRYFYELVDLEIKRAHRQNSAMTMLFLDLDNFKSINDSLGHIEGDTVLRKAAETLKSNLRKIDITARVGGDEFAVLMPNTNFDEAQKVLVRFKSVLDSVMQSNKWKVTVSIGAVTCPGQACSVDSLITNADHLMYEAKANGRNNIVHNNMDTIQPINFPKKTC